MGAEAYRHSCFNGAVTLYQTLVKILRQEQLNNDIGFYREMGFNLSYGHVKSALRAFVRVHDITLAEKGQYGVTHSCRSQPYIKTSNLVIKPPKNKTNVSIMSRSTLKAFPI